MAALSAALLLAWLGSAGAGCPADRQTWCSRHECSAEDRAELRREDGSFNELMDGLYELHASYRPTHARDCTSGTPAPVEYVYPVSAWELRFQVYESADEQLKRCRNCTECGTPAIYGACMTRARGGMITWLRRKLDEIRKNITDTVKYYDDTCM